MDWIDLALDRDQRRTLLNMVMSLREPYNSKKLFSTAQLAASQEGLSSIMMMIYT
jgi:hypothetical protein